MSWVKINTEFQLYYTQSLIYSTLSASWYYFVIRSNEIVVVFDYTADLIKKQRP